MSTQSPDTVRSLMPDGGTGAALLTVDGDALDHSSLVQETERLSQALRQAGIGPNDRVAVVLPNGPEMALTLLAVMSVACAAPLNPKYTPGEFSFYLGDLRPAALLVADERCPAITVAGGTPRILVTGSGVHIDFAFEGATHGDLPPLPSGEDQALVLHTSGTTARPKIVPLRQRHLAASARNIASSLRLNAEDRSLNVMPLFHIHGIMAGMLAPLSAGASVVAAPGFDAFKFGRWLEDLRPTYYSAVPTMHHLVLARYRPVQPTTLRFVRSSSSALPRGVLDRLQDRFGVPVIEAYGMTEASHQMTVNPLPPGVAKPGSVGLPAGIDVGVVDESKAFVVPKQTGEVVIRGNTVIEGYENNPAANEESFFDGWFRTGDEGFLDEDGYLFLTGRIKEQISRGGEKISPLEVEDVLLTYPSVAEAAVFAIPDDRLGEDVGAVVVPGDGPAPTEAELRQYLRERLAAFKVPRTIVFVEQIPTGATGKLQRIGMAEKLGLGGRTS